MVPFSRSKAVYAHGERERSSPRKEGPLQLAGHGEVASKRSLVEEKQALQVRREISLNVQPHFRELKCLQLILCILRDLLLNDSNVRYARTRLRPRPLFLLQLQQTSSWQTNWKGTAAYLLAYLSALRRQ